MGLIFAIFRNSARASECTNDGAVYTCEQTGHWADSKSVGSDERAGGLKRRKCGNREKSAEFTKFVNMTKRVFFRKFVNKTLSAISQIHLGREK